MVEVIGDAQAIKDFRKELRARQVNSLSFEEGSAIVPALPAQYRGLVAEFGLEVLKEQCYGV